jgi:hypothetical protein
MRLKRPNRSVGAHNRVNHGKNGDARITKKSETIGRTERQGLDLNY